MNYQSYSEEETFRSLFQLLLLSGNYPEKDIEKEVHKIMDNPDLYPQYFE